MNTAAASWVSGSAKLPPIWKTIRNANAFFRKLSLNAEKNWHQNKGAKRRDVIRLSAMLIPLGRKLAVLMVDSGTFADGNGPAPGGGAGRGRGSGSVAFNPHQEPLGAGILDAVHQFSG